MKINLDEVFEIGFQHGQDLVRYNYNDVEIDELMESLEDFEEKVRYFCWEADEGYRQYSPFEFFCHDMNEAENSEEAWERYDCGINEGIDFEITVYRKSLKLETLEDLVAERS